MDLRERLERFPQSAALENRRTYNPSVNSRFRTLLPAFDVMLILIAVLGLSSFLPKACELSGVALKMTPFGARIRKNRQFLSWTPTPVC